MVKVINATESEINTLFDKKEHRFLSETWAHYVYSGNFYIHLLPKDVAEETAEKIIKAIEGSHPYNSTVWIYKQKRTND